MLQGQKFDPCKRTFFMKRAGHLFKENSHCSMFGALCPSNKLLVCADLKRSAKKLENLFRSKVLYMYMYLPFGLFISSTYTCIYTMYTTLYVHMSHCLQTCRRIASSQTSSFLEQTSVPFMIVFRAACMRPVTSSKRAAAIQPKSYARKES